MKLLLDHNVPRGIRAHVTGHEVSTVHERGWATLTNGRLIQVAAAEGFQALLSLDKSLEHQQNLAALPLAIVALNAPSNALPSLLPLIGELCRLLESPIGNCLHVMELDGQVRIVT